MRKFISLLLAFCMLGSLGTAFAEEKTCPTCGMAVAGNFCSNCAFAEVWACANCGKTVAGNFCFNCGTAKGASAANGSDEVKLNGDDLTYY